MERGPEEMGEDAGVEVGHWSVGGVHDEVLVVPDDGVNAAGVKDVAEHDLTGLKRRFAEAEFEEFEDADFLFEVVFVLEETFA